MKNQGLSYKGPGIFKIYQVVNFIVSMALSFLGFDSIVGHFS